MRHAQLIKHLHKKNSDNSVEGKHREKRPRVPRCIYRSRCVGFSYGSIKVLGHHLSFNLSGRRSTRRSFSLCSGRFSEARRLLDLPCIRRSLEYRKGCLPSEGHNLGTIFRILWFRWSEISTGHHVPDSCGNVHCMKRCWSRGLEKGARLAMSSRSQRHALVPLQQRR